MDDYCFETPQVDDFVLSPMDKMFGGDDDKLSGQPGEPPRTQSQPTLPVHTATVVGGGTSDERDESSLNIPPLAAIYPSNIPKIR